MERDNPFALFKASEYTDEEINSLWVDIGSSAIIERIIEPKSGVSKFILGGKGTGKTHILRYFSYPVVRLRNPEVDGLSLVKRQGFLAVFLRATGVDAARFEVSSEYSKKWQQLFGIYLELRLVEGAIDSLCDIKNSSDQDFDDIALLDDIKSFVSNKEMENLKTVENLRAWIVDQRKRIDIAINNAAFSGRLEIEAPFSVGSFSLPIIKAVNKWNDAFKGIPIIYMVDEIENFSEKQQEVVNSLIRYAEGMASFRVTGRRYALKTRATMSGGEENREGSEFSTVFLDDILMSKGAGKFLDFSKKFILKRLVASGFREEVLLNNKEVFDPCSFFETLPVTKFHQGAVSKYKLDSAHSSYGPAFIKTLETEFRAERIQSDPHEIYSTLVSDFPIMLQKLNILLFAKKAKKNSDLFGLAEKISEDARKYSAGESCAKYYSNAYGHYSTDLLAQLFREAKTHSDYPYYGFDMFVRMASANPRNLLVILNRVHELATFKNIEPFGEKKVPLKIQSQAASEAARFMYESDTNFGSETDKARKAIDRLAEVLRTARYALNIPEVSPLAVSFSESDLSEAAARNLQNAINYSFVFEVTDGRADRNSDRVNRKIQLNPLLSPKWKLPIYRRGDISLNKILLCAIFDTQKGEEFDVLIKELRGRWNSVFRVVHGKTDAAQRELF
ncbi:hypothetical protein [Alloalcanivorax xenomutans]|uniref:ORC-CDC6 family AAA ATPase n=1 Tax=Alloalcanivorax xenomutans TaxID=1094342 RepID=UPI003C4865A3